MVTVLSVDRPPIYSFSGALTPPKAFPVARIEDDENGSPVRAYGANGALLTPTLLKNTSSTTTMARINGAAVARCVRGGAGQEGRAPAGIRTSVRQGQKSRRAQQVCARRNKRIRGSAGRSENGDSGRGEHDRATASASATGPLFMVRRLILLSCARTSTQIRSRLRTPATVPSSTPRSRMCVSH